MRQRGFFSVTVYDLVASNRKEPGCDRVQRLDRVVTSHELKEYVLENILRLFHGRDPVPDKTQKPVFFLQECLFFCLHGQVHHLALFIYRDGDGSILFYKTLTFAQSWR